MYVIVWFVYLYGKIIHELAPSDTELARALSFVQMHKPYNNFLIAPACIFTLYIVRCLMNNI